MATQIDIASNTQLTRVAEALESVAGSQMVLAASQASALTDFQAVRRVVRAGAARQVFAVGDQITVKWSDGTTEYDMPFDVVDFSDVEVAGGEVRPGLWLQSHYALPIGTMFDACEAFYYSAEGLAAGTYHFGCPTTWGSYFVAGDTYQFTLTQDLPAGGRLAVRGSTGAHVAPYSTAVSSWRVAAYASATADTYTELCEVTQGGAEGTDLGTLTTSGIDARLNDVQRFGLGYNRWAQSGLRQWLNATGTGWWASQNDFDMAPDYSARQGFMAGFEEGFVEVLGKVRCATYLNSRTDGGTSAAPASDVTYDTFFLPSLEQHYCAPYWADAAGYDDEGSAWEYWRQVHEADTPAALWKTWPEYRQYALNAKTSAQVVWTRSATLGSACYPMYVSSSGYVNYGYACYGVRAAPACVIC